ncbi:MAG: hypothetical protein NXH95_17110 [Pseudomonadaceae bacterium]|nr:hypothetical protein [Pseudomonadaceae bacterium]
MNVVNLIEQHPLLHADIRAYGLPPAKITGIARDISAQLGSADGNLCHVLNGLSTRDFVKRINAGVVATENGISAPLAQSIVLTLAPWIGQFQISRIETA